MTNIKNKKTDLKDRLAALMIYKELKEHSNPDFFIGSLDMTRRLEEEYGKENTPSHNTVAKYLKAMKDYSEELDIDVRRGNSKQGYCLGEREFSAWEMDLLVSAAINSKTLSLEDKRDIIIKCYKHLGLEGDEIDIVLDYIIDAKGKRKKQKQEEKENIPEILEKLDESIKNKKQIKMYLSGGYLPDTASLKNQAFFVVSPYKIFTYNDNTYLMYGIEHRNSKAMRPFVLNYREIRNIYDVEILDSKNYYPLEKYEPFKNGIDLTKLNRDPFGYIRQKENETVQIEIVSGNEKTVADIKEKLKKEFNENVEFAKKNSRQIAYISSNTEKCMQFLFTYSDVCIVTGPESWKTKFKSKLMRTVMKYDSHKKNYSNMIDFIDSDDYIEKAHLSVDAEKEYRARQNDSRKKISDNKTVGHKG